MPITITCGNSNIIRDIKVNLFTLEYTPVLPLQTSKNWNNVTEKWNSLCHCSIKLSLQAIVHGSVILKRNSIHYSNWKKTTVNHM